MHHSLHANFVLERNATRSYTAVMATRTKQTFPPLQLLGGISADKFCADYWHQKPLLIRQAIPDFKAPLSRDALFSLAAREDVQSRLITAFSGKWSFKHGPFTKLPPVKKPDWTLLVQGVNLHDDICHSLLQQFNFIERARLDDVMISYATAGGGVGPHFDSYDVFLLQAYGQRQWRISTQKDLSLIESLPLKILKNFRHTQEFVLEPGDMLYLPPHVAHEGVAIGECMTCSIGFRAPSHVELLKSFHVFMADVLEAPGQLSNAQPAAAIESQARLPESTIDAVAALIARHAPSREDIIEFLGCALTEPKTMALFDEPAYNSPSRVYRKKLDNEVRLARATLTLHSPGWFFINGTSWRVKGADAKLLVRLAQDGRLSWLSVTQASRDMQHQLKIWIEDGWLIQS